MIIDPKLYPRILALPLAFRRLLAESEESGLWISIPIDGEILEWSEKRPSEIYEPSIKLDSGWAFLPSDPTAWLKAACGYAGWDWWGINDEGCAVGGNYYTPEHSNTDPVSLACQVVEEYERRRG